MSPDPEADLARLREICLALPRAAEKLSHGAPAFFIEKGKVFAYFSHNHHGDGRTAVQVKTSGLDEQAMLVEAESGLYYVPPYIGHAGWVGLRLDTGGTDWEHVADRVARSWRLVAPARLAPALD
ncbi:MmcQ/YjbR family DNA-binding protein [Sphingomonas canadensis]|uniref:MmcQ/YjbR family DNA-binding protein n=1 Tax=Sphingomonas canadensis TaxID=1219257 RepID=A0ABW3H9T1_9SPHN|nr:MmcQ/YjbR family DNA-binding protein [Sphingomonas canadensis]MCW3837958.1 MmcQ/YjbR family DNA-binding protein [Sphingomonas canadensis]